MVRAAVATLQAAGYDISPFQVLIRADMPLGYRAMTLDDGAIVSVAAFSSQEMVNHVLEEELLHHNQKAQEPAREFMRGLARDLEAEVHEQRRFPLPKD